MFFFGFIPLARRIILYNVLTFTPNLYTFAKISTINTTSGWGIFEKPIINGPPYHFFS